MKEKLNIRILDKHSKWWAGEKNISWAIQEGDDWWLIKADEESDNKTKVKTKSSRNGCRSTVLSTKQMLYIFLCCFFGASLAIGACVALALFL